VIGKQKNSNRLIILGVVLITFIIGILLLRNWTAVGTSLANPMRKLIGVRGVAQLETLLFNLQDGFKQWQYNLGLAEAESPWESPPDLASLPPANPAPTRNPQSTATITSPTAAPMKTESGDKSLHQDTETSSTPSIQTPITTNQPTPMQASWTLPNLKPFGEVPNEGVWQPYIHSPDGMVAALRTFLQPDPERPYALVAIAAFDLTKVQLHYILGLKEPAKPGGPHGWGLIPEEDKQPGKLLAAFNGGFIFEHGNYGAMAAGVYPIALRHGLATLAIYEDGAVRIGEWGSDLKEGENYIALRQNAPPIIHNGEINPKVYTGTWVEWGANLDYSTVTLRSGVGLRDDNQVLYYFAGPSLSMPVLADAMAATGVHNGMLLDINPTHAHFTVMRVVDGQLTAEPLFEEEMNIWVDRYLRQWDLDFFYVTARE
jgi:hypothetical protein